MRQLYSTLINADSERSIAFAPTTAFAISLAAENIMRSGKLGPGKKIILVENEMGSNVYPWQHACTVTGAALEIVAFPPPGQSWAEAIIGHLDKSTAVVSVGASHWCDGSAIDLHLVAAAVKALSPAADRPYLIVDGTQSIGAMPFDVSALEPDFVSCSVHKWLLVGRGSALLYLHPRHHAAWLPLDHHERSREGAQHSFWDDIGTMGTAGYPEVFQKGARRIDAGGGYNFVQMAMLEASLQLLTTRWSPRRIYPYLTSLTDALANHICKAFPSGPLYVLPKAQRSGNIIGIRVSDSAHWAITPERIVEDLQSAHNIIAVVRLGVIRISPYIFHSIEDMERVALSLVDVVASLQERPRVLVTGGSGWLAQHLFKALSPAMDCCSLPLKWDVHVTSRVGSERPMWVPPTRFHEMDLAGDAAVRTTHAIISLVRPAAIIHCAAVSTIATCESSAFAASVNAPQALIDAVKKHVPKALFVFTSTDIVYAGRREPYPAVDPDNAELQNNPPLCVYGRCKLQFERMLAADIQNYVVLRLSNSLGARAPFQPTGTKFLEFLEHAANERQSVYLKNDEIRSFVDIRDVVRLISLILCASENTVYRAVYNVGGPEGLSRVDLAMAVAAARSIPIKVIGFNEVVMYSTLDECAGVPWIVHSVSSDEIIQRNPSTAPVVPVPQRVVMESTSTEQDFGFKFKSICEMLKSTSTL